MITQHTVQAMSVKTARKDGTKYLGKDGSQAWRVSLKIGEDWYAKQIYDEALIPKKGQTIHIEYKEEDGWKNWDYKLLTKKEQILGGTSEQPTHYEVKPNGALEFSNPPPPTQEVEKKPDDIQERIIRGMCFNNACALVASGAGAQKNVVEDSKAIAKLLYEEMKDWLSTN